MDKLKKVGLTALGTALVSSSAFAAEMTVTGSAKLTFVGSDKDDRGNGWSGTDSFNVSASTDLDNGFTVSHSQNIGNDNDNNATTTIAMGDMGTIAFMHEDGSSIIGKYDDMMPAANEEPWFGTAGGVPATRGASGPNLFRYSVSVMDGLTFEASHVPSSASSIESSNAYGVVYSGVEGLTVGLVTGENNDGQADTTGGHGAGDTIENTSMFLTYAMDAFTIGVQNNETDSETANADYDYRGYGVSYAVSEDVSVSYGIGSMEFENSSLEDQEHSAIGVSYTNGSVTISGSMHEGNNLAGSSAAANDRKGYELNIGFAF